MAESLHPKESDDSLRYLLRFIISLFVFYHNTERALLNLCYYSLDLALLEGDDIFYWLGFSLCSTKPKL